MTNLQSTNNSLKYTVFVFANLKPSQIYYKIVPLSKSQLVEKVYILRKTPLDIDEEKIECLHLSWILRIRPLYWFFTSFYGTILIKKKKANLILSYNILPHGFNGYIASLLTRLPFIYAEIVEDTMSFYKKNIKRFLIKKILNRASFILVPGTRTSAFWNQNGLKKTYQLHSTIDTNYYKPKSSILKEYDFLFIGEFDKRKQPELILSAFAEVRKKGNSTSLCMIGYGNLKQKIVRQIKEIGLAESIDLIQTNDVLNYYLKSKILILASLAEGIPCVMMEAMACELVVVVPPVGDITDVIQHSVNGYLHDNSKDDLVHYMLEAYKNFDSLSSMRQKARETIINEHSYDVATSKWDELLINF